MTDISMDPADVYRAYIAAEAAGDQAAMHALLARDIKIELNGRPAFESADQDATASNAIFEAFPGYRREIIEIIEQGEVASARWRMVGTPREDLRDRLGELDIAGCTVVRVRDGHIVNAYVWSPLSILDEIVAMLSPGSG